MSEPRAHRPATLGPRALSTFAGDGDPARRIEAAHDVAAAIVAGGRSSTDDAVTARLLTLVDDHGIDVVAGLWADQGPETLPGTLWRMYALRTWVRARPESVARDFEAGRRLAPAEEVVAGVADPPGPDQVRDLADAVLSGLYRGDLAVALERAAAFCRVVSVGRALGADDSDAYLDHERATRSTREAADLAAVADELERAALAWREDRLS